MVNDPQDDLLDLIKQECAKAVMEKRAAIHFEQAAEDDEHLDYSIEQFKLVVYVDGHDLWKVGLNKWHDQAICVRCNAKSGR